MHSAANAGPIVLSTTASELAKTAGTSGWTRRDIVPSELWDSEIWHEIPPRRQTLYGMCLGSNKGYVRLSISLGPDPYAATRPAASRCAPCARRGLFEADWTAGGASIHTGGNS